MKGYHDIEGDGGSGVVRQVLEKRARIAESLEGVRQLLAIGSGKGGVGKSTLTAQLARTFRERGLEVAILDADFNGPSQARLLDVTETVLVPRDGGMPLPRSRDGIGVFSMGSLVPEDRAVELESVAEGDSHTWRATKEFAVLGDLLGSFAWGKLDLLLVDLPPGAERTQQYAEFFGPTTAFVLVTLPSELARGIVARSVAALRSTPNRILGYVENMSGYWCADCGRVQPLFPGSVGRDLGIPLLGSVPFDPELARSCDAGDLSGGACAEQIREIASRILDSLERAA